MSMNLHVSAVRTVTVNKTGKESKQTCHFHLWQTPTFDTRAMLASGDPRKAYIEWMTAQFRDDEELIYADDDWLAERDPIGTCIVNDGKEHVAEFIKWLAECEEEGYDIEFYEL